MGILFQSTNNSPMFRKDVWHKTCHVHHMFSDFQHSAQRAIVMMIAIILLLLVPSAVAQSTSEPSWDTKPSNQVQELGLNVSLDCRVYNLNGRLMTWIKVQGSVTTVLFINDQNFLAPSRYGVTFGVQNISTTLTLHLTSVERDDDAQYQCSIQGVQLSAVASVTILVSPGIPTISLNTKEEDLKENTVIQFNCSSSGGNPPPNMTWNRNGELLPISSLVLPTTKFGTTSSILVWQLTRMDFGANFTCAAENKDIQGSLVENSTRLLVKYAPVISLGSFNPLTVVENSLMKLNCNISAYPEVDPTAVLWYMNGSLIGNGSSFTLTSVTVGDAGIYTCSAKNFDVRSANVTVNVQYPPKAEPRFREVSAKKGSSVNLTMAFNANPVVNSSSVKWFNGNSFVQSGSFLFIQEVNQSHAGNYTWEATNTLMPSQGTQSQGIGQATLRLRVLYKPGKATVQVPAVIVVGQNASLTCSVDDPGDPAADLVWSRVGRNNTYLNGTVLQIFRAQLSDIGNYSCLPKNDVGLGQSDVKLLDITELASWIQQTLPSGINVSVNGTIDGVTCQARGRPAPTVNWYKDGQLISINSSLWYSVSQESHVLEEYSWNVTSTLKWIGSLRRPNSNSLRPEDAGSYTCQASVPSTAMSVNQTMTVNIIYSPRMESSDGTMGFDAGTPASVVCHSQAFPPPNFIWSRGTTKLESTGKYQIRNFMTSAVFLFQSELNINGFSISDTGNYTCQATNAIGSSLFSFSLTMNSEPSSPKQLKVISYTWESIELEWQEGSDGGSPQHFLVETQQTSPVSAGNITRYNLTGLYPNTTYLISVQAENRLGRGNSSNSVSQTTNAFILEMPFDVQYHTQSRTLTCSFSQTDDVCIKLLVHRSSGSMYNFSECDLPSNGKVEIKLDELAMPGGGETQAIEVSVCRQQRMDVCTRSQTAQFVSDLPVQMIIIICCVCGGFIIILLIVLIVCCCCRKKRRESYSEEQHAISAYETSSKRTENGMKKNADSVQYTDGIDNPALQHPAIMYGKNGAFFNLDHLYPLDRSDSNGSYGSDSGVSVSEVPKTKRIIHEVIV